jgi:hypothetical protein
MDSDDMDLDLDDMDLDSLNIPLPSMGKNTAATDPSLSLHKYMSFGLTKPTARSPEKKLDQSKIEDKNLNNIFTAPLPVPKKKGPSIASFLKDNIKSSTMNVFKGMSATAPLLMTPSQMTLKDKTPSFSGNFNKANEESKGIEPMDMDEFDDFDDMDFDDIPEPTMM